MSVRLDIGERSCKVKKKRRFVVRRTHQPPGSGVGQRGQGNFELAANFDYIHAGRLTRAKVYVSVGFQSFP